MIDLNEIFSMKPLKFELFIQSKVMIRKLPKMDEKRIASKLSIF